MGFIRKAVRGTSITAIGVPLAHKRSKKDRIVDSNEAIAEELRLQREMVPSPGWVPTPLPPIPPPSGRAGVADELAKLAGLYQQGFLSLEEFEAQKAQLLGR